MKMFCLVLGVLVIIVFILVVVKLMLKCLIYLDDIFEEYDEDVLSVGVDIGDSMLDMLNKDFDFVVVGFLSDGILQLLDLYGDEDLFKVVCVLVVNELELFF